MNLFTKSTLSALLILGGGCVAPVKNYESVAASQTSATITFSKGYVSSAFKTGSQAYFLANAGNCADLRHAGSFLWTSPDSRSLRVPGNERVTVVAGTNFDNVTGIGNAPGGFTVEMQKQGCVGAATFLAEPGRSYAVTQQITAPACRMVVIDIVSRAAPKSLRTTDGAACDVHVRTLTEYR